MRSRELHSVAHGIAHGAVNPPWRGIANRVEHISAHFPALWRLANDENPKTRMHSTAARNQKPVRVLARQGARVRIADGGNLQMCSVMGRGGGREKRITQIVEYCYIHFMRKISRTRTRLSLILKTELKHNQKAVVQKSPIEALALQARAFPVGSLERDFICRKILRERMGLCKTIANQTGAKLDYGDILGYLWIGILKAVDEWEPERAGIVTTIVVKARNAISEDAYWGHMVGSVRVPKASRLFVGLDVDKLSEMDLHNAIENLYIT